MKIKAHHHSCKIMGCAFVLTAVDPHAVKAWNAIRAAEVEMRRIEELISSWNPDSETSRVNENSGQNSVNVSQELFRLIERSLTISELTEGAFDISGTLSRYYWDFNRTVSTIPNRDRIEELRNLIDYKCIILDDKNNSVYLSKKGMKIGFGGIGKGYAAERAKSIMQSYGLVGGLVNASGDLLCWGSTPKESPWKIKIPNPSVSNGIIAEVELEYGSVVTSGSSVNFTVIDGIRYSHIINPRTGMPITHTNGVSVVAPNAEFADAIATGLFVLGEDEGIALVNKLHGVEAVIVNTKEEISFSNQLNLQAYA